MELIDAWNINRYIPYIRLFTCHVFSANATLKPCIKSTLINISRNHSKILNLPDLQETVSNLRKCIFHDFDILANIAEHGCTRKKPDIRYVKCCTKQEL